MKVKLSLILIFFTITFTTYADVNSDFVNAIENDLLDEVENLIENGVDVNIQLENNWTPLMLAVSNSTSLEMIKLLINAGADVNARDENGRTPLMFAARYSELPGACQMLIKAGADINARDKNGRTPFMYLVEAGNIYSLYSLDKAGAEINTHDNNGWTPFMYAVEYSPYEEYIKYFIEKGVDINAPWFDGITPLMHVSIYHTPRTSRYLFDRLIENGADINIKDKNGVTAVIYAVVYNEDPESVLTYLQTFGADMQVHSPEGENLLMLVLLNENAHPHRIYSTILRLTNTRSRHKIGLNVNSRNDLNQTPLMYAVSNNNISRTIVKYLIEKGADINAKANDGSTALMYAVSKNDNSEVIQLLINEGARIDVKNEDGKTAWDYIQENESLIETDAYFQLKDLMRK